MKMTARKAVDPIIATLLLIAIAVAAGIIVYVYVNSLAGGLTSGGGSQVSDQISMDAYNFGTLTAPVITIRDVGSGSISISNIFLDGQVATLTGTGTPAGCATGTSIAPTSTCQFTLNTSALGITSGTSHTLKILTTDGGTAVMTIIAGRSG
jgi:flagellin-like protein